MSSPRRRFAGVLWLTLLLALGAGTAGAQAVRVVSDGGGQRLQVDGRDFMVLGMNWDYVPIGENYNYSLWNQPDALIIDALAREMPLLQELGVNAIRQYVGIPPRWLAYIYEHYGIYTVLNHTMARYGYTLDGVWIPSVDYSDPRLRAAVKAEILALVEEYRGTPGLLMWLLGNENNYGLSWSSFEIEALPAGEREAARARHLYSLFGEITTAIKQLDGNHPVAIANGDIQYIDIIAEKCRDLDVLGTNVYRGISVRDLFDVVREKLGIPVLLTEFGADAYNARTLSEDQATQARYLVGQWRELYEQSAGKGRTGNAIGGLVFQWSDGWWKYRQEERLDVHDTHASWPNGGYVEDYQEGENNMNEEWWGITAKGRPDHRGLYAVYPRAAYYVLRQAFALDPYGPGTDLAAIAAHFGAIRPLAAEVQARGDRAALANETGDRVRLAGLRVEMETFNTGGERTSTPPAGQLGDGYPAFRGFDHLQSFYLDAEARPAESVQGSVSVNVLGNVPVNPINEIFYENRGRARTVNLGGEELALESLERVRVHNAALSWDDRWFQLAGFYRTGHLHWGFEGDFFGLYRNAYYGENIDIYNGMAPLGVEIAGKRQLAGLKLAFGPQLWWGANPAVLLKLQRQLGRLSTTVIYHEDIAPQSAVNSSIAIPLPETRKLALQIATTRGKLGIELGGLWAGSTKLDQTFQIADETATGYRILQDTVRDSDTFGVKAKLTFAHGRWLWYGQGASMGLVADAGPTEVITYTGWSLKDTGSGNQRNLLTGLTVAFGDFQFGPNVLWQKPWVGPMPGDVPAPGRPRNVLDDPFAVRANRETVGAELLITYDPTPATWFWAWDNEVREDARLAASLGFVYRDQKTTQDASNFVAEDGRTIYAFAAAPPAQSLWELRSRIASRLGAQTRLVANVYGGMVEPNGWDPTAANEVLNRFIHRYGADARITHGPLAFASFLKVDDWGPYDYHRDFNLTYPLQLMGDLSYTLGAPRWFGYPQTRFGVRASWRSLDVYSPRYSPTGGDALAGYPNGSEWEIGTYLHLSL
ncbi:glycosidase [bacterium]|nr:glycosidase [bacterium]